MSMYQVCIREVDKKSDRIIPESGELTASPDPRPSHLYIPSSRQADPRRKPRTKHLSQPTRGVGDLEGVPDTRSGGSVLEVPQAPMRGYSPASSVRYNLSNPNPRKSHSPASVNRYNLSNPNPRKPHSPASGVRYAISNPNPQASGSQAPWRIRARYLWGRRNEPALHR